MKVIDAGVEWHFGYGNSPNLVIVVDAMPEARQDWVYKTARRRSTVPNLWYYESEDGFVSFFSLTMGAKEKGFGGAIYNIKADIDGVVQDVALHGPWSSRAGVMNAAGFGPCMDVTMYSLSDKYGMGYGAHCSLAVGQEAARIAGVELIKAEDDGDIRWDIKVDLKDGNKWAIIKPSWSGGKDSLTGKQLYASPEDMAFKDRLRRLRDRLPVAKWGYTPPKRASVSLDFGGKV